MTGKKWIAFALTVWSCAFGAWQTGSAQTLEEKEVMETFARFADAYGKDVPAIAGLYHDDLAYGHSGGSFETKDQVLHGMPGWEWLKIKSSSVKVTGPVAVVRTVMDFRVGGQQVTDMSILWVLVKEQQGWKVLVRQAVKTAATVIAPVPK